MHSRDRASSRRRRSRSRSRSRWSYSRRSRSHSRERYRRSPSRSRDRRPRRSPRRDWSRSRSRGRSRAPYSRRRRSPSVSPPLRRLRCERLDDLRSGSPFVPRRRQRSKPRTSTGDRVRRRGSRSASPMATSADRSSAAPSKGKSPPAASVGAIAAVVGDESTRSEDNAQPATTKAETSAPAPAHAADEAVGEVPPPALGNPFAASADAATGTTEEGSHAPARGRGARRGKGRGRSAPRGGKGRKKVSIPDNWTDVAKMGAIVGTSRFLPLRVPLDDKYTGLLKCEEDVWTPQRFLEAQGTAGLNVRMLIDLTNTFKYYDGVSAFADTPVEYVKLKIAGFHGPPSERDVAKFVEIVDAFVAKEPLGVIAVHCTHGLNRTGYLIVNYMVERHGSTVTEALEAFAVARPPGLIKHMYVEELYQRLGPSETVKLPELPNWAAGKYGKRKH